jgi:hypothetical protein
MFFSNLCLEFDISGKDSLLILVKFDGKIVFKDRLSENHLVKKISHRFLDLPIHHKLTIQINGKTTCMTEINAHGDIIEDTCFRLRSITLDNVALGEVFYSNTKYIHDLNGQSDSIITIQPSDISGFNGCIEWQFHGFVKQWLYKHGFTDQLTVFHRIKNYFFKNYMINLVLTFLTRFFKIRYFPKYVHQMIKWKKLGGSVDGYYPGLINYSGTEAGSSFSGNNEKTYDKLFYQDILVASHIHDHKPVRHVTVGSYITGFVGHVATFMPIHVCDIRPLTKTFHPNITFIQKDLASKDFYSPDLVTDSVSCLNTIHHVGTGRYGGEVNPNGPFLALDNLQKILKPGGMMYLSTNISPKPKTVYNLWRSFTVNEILNYLPNFDLIRIDWVDWSSGTISQNVSKEDFGQVPERAVGIFILKSKCHVNEIGELR